MTMSPGLKPAVSAGELTRTSVISAASLYMSRPLNATPSSPGISGSPVLNRSRRDVMSSSGTAKPIPESYHSAPAISELPCGDMGTRIPMTRPSMSTSAPP